MSEQSQPHHEFLRPRDKIEHMQAAFDTELKNVLQELAVWNFWLQEAYAKDKETGEETHLQLALEAKHTLDTQWSYYEDWILVSGQWDINRPIIDHKGVINDESVDEPIFAAAKSNGFEVDIKRDGPPEVGFSFKTGQTVVINKSLYGPLESLAFARPDKVSLSLARIATELDYPKEQLIKAVKYYDGLLKRYTHESSDFYRKSSRLQQQFFDSLINDLTETVTAPAYVTLCQYAEVPYIYRRGKQSTISNQGLDLEYIQQEGNILLSGVVRGVTILDTLYATDEPLRSKDDLIDPDAGICFIISASEGSLEDEQIDERDFIVPARLIKELDIVIK